MSKPACKTCAHYEAHEPDKGWGYCVANPPVILHRYAAIETTDSDGTPYLLTALEQNETVSDAPFGQWPAVSEGDRCGKHIVYKEQNANGN